MMTDSDLLEELKKFKKEVDDLRRENYRQIGDNYSWGEGRHKGPYESYEWMYGRLVAIVSQSQ